VSKLPLSETDNIPTLTDIVSSGSSPVKKSPSAVISSPPKSVSNPAQATAVMQIDRKQLEKLIYKKLHQNLPDLCQQIADKIIAEFSPGPESDAGESGKPRKHL
jgi:hypothetical protein